MKDINGVLPALLTPFTKTGTIHTTALKNHVDFVIDKGVGGVYACGTFGAGPLLSTEEHKEFSALLVKAVNGRVPVIVHVGTTTIKGTVELAKHCEAVGVDAVASVPPYYYTHTQDTVLRFYSALLESVKIPVFAYNNPPQVGYGIEPSTLAKIADMGAYGIKDSSFDIKVLVRFMNAVSQPDFKFICGTVPIYYAALTMGAVAGVGGPANVFPELQIELYNELKAGNLERCRELQLKLMRLVAIQGMGGIPFTTLIAMLELRGVEYGAYPHDPWERVPNELKEQLREALVKEDLL